MLDLLKALKGLAQTQLSSQRNKKLKDSGSKHGWPVNSIDVPPR